MQAYIICDRLGRTIRYSHNLRGLLDNYRRNPDDLVVKVVENPAFEYDVTFYWPRSGETAKTHWADWRVLLQWLRARRSWSIDQITFHAPLYDKIGHDAPEIAATRKAGIVVTRHAYLHP